MLGLVLQRALLVCWAACVPITLMWQRVSVLLGLLHQAPEIVDGAARWAGPLGAGVGWGAWGVCGGGGAGWIQHHRAWGQAHGGLWSVLPGWPGAAAAALACGTP